VPAWLDVGVALPRVPPIIARARFRDGRKKPHRRLLDWSIRRDREDEIEFWLGQAHQMLGGEPGHGRLRRAVCRGDQPLAAVPPRGRAPRPSPSRTGELSTFSTAVTTGGLGMAATSTAAGRGAVPGTVDNRAS
jgi:hypothetical protein